jgi:hypothetical protein
MYKLSREDFFHPLPLFVFGYSAVAPFLPARYGMLSRAQVNKQQRPSSQPLKLYLPIFQRNLILVFLFSISNYRPIMFPSSLNASNQIAVHSTSQNKCKRAQLPKKTPTERTEELLDNLCCISHNLGLCQKSVKNNGLFRKHLT